MSVSRLFNTTDDALAAVGDLKQLGFKDKAIKVVASRVAGGGTCVVVDTPMGAAGRATTALERVRPGDVGTPKAEYKGWGDSQYFSSVMQVPVILLDDPTPLSSFFHLPTVFKAPLKVSSLLGLKLLSKNGAVFSSLFNIPLLLKN